ncbi:hypothetical protein F503_03123 [Ophiostoma piceae UAMH 11346]|uniref:Uncharacterized protein n=1 Tax=Ophiostoma piceae (strain UAMH 11346) TaxID=1262450 RepID=S3C4G2_OPHP1|nr:hypothetical protein F503_03123 [Ophiostoma piceae UAMH 11346]
MRIASATQLDTNTTMLTPRSESLGELVEDLTTAFETASHLYRQWKSRRERSNHYRKPGTTALKTLVAANCALTTSLNLGTRIKEAYSVGAAILGHPFVQGDSSGRRALILQRDFLMDQVVTLKQAVSTDAASGPLDINAILQTSETARIVCVQALVDQYRRMVMDHDYAHDLPRELPIPKWRSPSRDGPVPEPRRDGRITKDRDNTCPIPTDKRRASQVPHAPTRHTQLQPPDPYSPIPDDDTPPLTTNGLAPAPPVQQLHQSQPPEPTLAIPHTTAPSARWLTYLEDDIRTTAWSVLSGPLVFQSEPPSPPLTPKELASLPPVPPLPQEYRLSAANVTLQQDGMCTDRATKRDTMRNTKRSSRLESAYNCDGADTTAGDGVHPLSSVSAKTGASLVRPKNSVFHIFCPEAMALQVDVRRPVPTTRKCRCGFLWETENSNNSISSLQSGKSTKSMTSFKSIGSAKAPVLQLKEGFGMSRRFLAKSHCEGGRADGNGFGCVLCTSSGVAQTYETAEDLRVHINAAHDKWQMLHDRDLA